MGDFWHKLDPTGDNFFGLGSRWGRQIGDMMTGALGEYHRPDPFGTKQGTVLNKVGRSVGGAGPGAVGGFITGGWPGAVAGGVAGGTLAGTGTTSNTTLSGFGENFGAGMGAGYLGGLGYGALAGGGGASAGGGSAGGLGGGATAGVNGLMSGGGSAASASPYTAGVGGVTDASGGLGGLGGLESSMGIGQGGLGMGNQSSLSLFNPNYSNSALAGGTGTGGMSGTPAAGVDKARLIRQAINQMRNQQQGQGNTGTALPETKMDFLKKIYSMFPMLRPHLSSQNNSINFGGPNAS